MTKIRQLSSTEEVIAALGGKQAVMTLTGRSWSAVWNWENRKSFPANTYAVLKPALESTGATAPDSLWGMSTISELAS